jgi:hypothetical protein
MGPMAIPMAMQGLQTGVGLVQSIMADRPDAPEYQIPDEVFQAQQIMEERMRTGLPGKDIMRGELDSAFAGNVGAVKEVSSGGSLIGATADMYGDLLKGVRDIELMDAQFRDTAKTDFAGAKMETAKYRDREWDENERIPYEREYNEFINKRNAGAQNFFGGMGSMGKTFMANQSHNDMMAMIDAIFGTSGSGGEGFFNKDNTTMDAFTIPPRFRGGNPRGI